MHPVTRYFKALESVQTLRGFLQDDTIFRFAALPLAEMEEPPAMSALWNAAGELQSRGGMARTLALVAAALFARRGDLPGGIASQARHLVAVRDVLDSWGPSAGATAFALALGVGGGRPVPVLERARRIHDLWRRDHSWLTGEDDWPTAAWHAARGAEPAAVAAATEEAHRALVALNFARANTTQLAAQILALARVRDGLRRFELLQGALRDRNQPRSLWGVLDVALLALFPDPPAELARDLVTRTEAQLKGPDAPARMTAPSLAALMVSRERSKDRDRDDFLTLRVAAMVSMCRELGE
ncbi:MAG: DUF4003 family protein [Planctomycetia bacterium]|nr:DUF4003 family protein [Planctomycetia bacterium]